MERSSFRSLSGAETGNYEELLLNLLDFITLDPLTSAVTLDPCSHKVNELTAKQFFGDTDDGGSVINPRPCPVCRKEVKAYFPDYQTRSTVAKILELQADQKREEDSARLCEASSSKIPVRNWTYVDRALQAGKTVQTDKVEELSRERISHSIDSMNESDQAKFTSIGMARHGMFPEALELVQTITSEKDQAYAVSEIFKDMVQTGNFDEALEMAETIKVDRARFVALDRIAKAMFDAGLWDDAEDIASEITNLSYAVGTWGYFSKNPSYRPRRFKLPS